MSTITFEQKFSVPRDMVWQCLTQLPHIKKWWFSQIRVFESHEGFQTRFTVNYEGDKYVHLWEVLESIPQEKLVIDWRYANHPGKAYAQFELQSIPSGTLLTFTSDVLEFFPNHKVFSRVSMLNGWKTLLQERLPEYVQKNN